MKFTLSATGITEVRSMMQRIGPALSTKALAITAEQIEDYVRQEAGKHEKTGALNSSIFKHRLPDTSWEIGHDLRRAAHAVFVLFGTRAHTIRPKKKHLLRWPGGGKFTFAKVVHHPGNKADNWIERAAAKAPQQFAAQVQAQLTNLRQG